MMIADDSDQVMSDKGPKRDLEESPPTDSESPHYKRPRREVEERVSPLFIFRYCVCVNSGNEDIFIVSYRV